MPVPTGTASLLDIQNEFGGSNPISLSEYYGAADGIPTSGAISINDFRGKSAISVFTHTITTNQQELNLDTYLVSQGWNGTDAVEVTVNNGVYIWSDNSNSATSAALYVGLNNSYPSGLTLINKGYIMGRGGDGYNSIPILAEPLPQSIVNIGKAAIRSVISFTISGISGAYIGGGGGGGVVTGTLAKGIGGGAGGGAGGGIGGYGQLNSQTYAYGGQGGAPGQPGSDGEVTNATNPTVAGGGGAGGGGGADLAMGGGGGGRIFPGSGGTPGSNGGVNFGGTGGFSNTPGTASSQDFNSGYGGAGWGATSLANNAAIDDEFNYLPGHPGGNAVQFTTSGKSITWAGDYANSTIFNNHVWGAVGL